MKKMMSATMKIRGGVERDSYGKKAGKGALIQWEKSATLGVSQDQTLFVWAEMENDRDTEKILKRESDGYGDMPVH